MPGFARFGLPLSARLRPAEARLLALVFSVLGLILAFATVHTITGVGGKGLDKPTRDWVSSAVYVLVAGVVAARALRSTTHRRAWTLFALGLGLYGAGNLVWAFWLEHVKHPPIPSICDGLWLTLYPLSYAGIVGVARVRGQRQAPANLWLDGLIAGAGLAAIGAALVFHSVLASTSGGSIAVATELAYPVGDLLLAALVVGVLALRGWRLDYTWGLLTAGFLVLALADCLYAVQVAQGNSVPSSAANLFYMLGVILLAFAAWQVEPATHAQPVARWSVLLLPAGFTLGALGLLVYDHFHRLDPFALGLAILTLLAAIVRMALAFRDVRSLAEARRQASTDDLTLLPNRRMFMDRTQDAIAAARIVDDHCAVLMLDLDNFKELNDTLGHDAGDLLLRRVGPRLKRVLRSTDTVARLGGDEFGILLDPLPDVEAAARVAAKLLHALAEPFPVQGLKLRLMAGIGIAAFPEHGRDADELLRRAEITMYQAKAARTGYAFYAPERDTNSRHRLILAGELAVALEEGRIEVYFQPKAEARTRRVVGAEALVRWRRADGSLALPADFIPAAEQAGLARALTRHVLRQALEQLQRWRAQGHDLHIAVNSTVADLLDNDFPDEVARALDERGLPPETLVLEVTESSIISDPARIGNVLGQLGELGIDLSLDDFGTGYSSLSHLRAFPVREVKVDRSFVSWMCSDQTDAAIVFATIQLAHKLGMRVVAEGVEDENTWQALSDLGCELIQGFALGRPVPAAELEGLLAARAKRLLPTGWNRVAPGDAVVPATGLAPAAAWEPAPPTEWDPGPVNAWDPGDATEWEPGDATEWEPGHALEG